MDTKRLEAEKKLFKRLVISHWDIQHAQRFARLILNRNLFDSFDASERDLLHALNTALIVAYWRPFSENKSTSDTWAVLPDSYLHDFSPSEKTLHEHIHRLRNKGMAHSDSEAHGVRVIVSDFAGRKTAIPTGWNPHVPLSKADVEMLLGMTEKLMARISEEHLRIETLLPIGKEF
jgi:hypothetical protein